MHVTCYVLTFGSYIGTCKTLVCIDLVLLSTKAAIDIAKDVGLKPVVMDFAIVAIVLLTVASPSLGAGSNYIVT